MQWPDCFRSLKPTVLYESRSDHSCRSDRITSHSRPELQVLPVVSGSQRVFTLHSLTRRNCVFSPKLNPVQFTLFKKKLMHPKVKLHVYATTCTLQQFLAPLRFFLPIEKQSEPRRKRHFSGSDTGSFFCVYNNFWRTVRVAGNHSAADLILICILGP